MNVCAAFARLRIASPLNSLRHQPWAASTAIAPRLDSSQLIEEENTPYYRPEHFYPVNVGGILQDRYQVATKLGYGSGSTVWLARDLWRYRWQSERYVAIKVSSSRKRDDACSELAMLKLLSKPKSQHKGWLFVRKLQDSFSIGDADRKNVCLVFEPMREPLWLYAKRFPGGVISPKVMKIMLNMILQALDYLHTDCQIIHADLKPDNIMVKLEDHAILERDAQDEHENPLPQKEIDGRVIYLSRNNFGRPSVPIGILQIVDFDRSVLGATSHSGCIQAEIYRAPEVILDIGYTYSADIWSLGVMLWDFMEGTKLFNVTDPGNVTEHDDHRHLARITSLLGPRPKGFADGQRTSMYYNNDGCLREQTLAADQISFDSVIESVKGEEKAMFINFVKRMIKWCPEERSTAKELLHDPWLNTDFPQD